MQAAHGLFHFAGGHRHLQRQPHDAGVRPELIDRGDAIRVTRHQADLALVTKLERRGQLRQRRGLAHPGRPDQRHRQGTPVRAAVGYRRIRGRNVLGQLLQHGLAHGRFVVPVISAQLVAHHVDDPVGELLGEVLPDQLQVQLKEFFRHGRSRGREHLLLQHLADHVSDGGELLVHFGPNEAGASTAAGSGSRRPRTAGRFGPGDPDRGLGGRGRRGSRG